MKYFVLLVVSVSLSACATAPERSKANLAIDSEPTEPLEVREPEVTTAPTDEPAPEGEISLGIEGGSTGELVVESAGEVEAAEPAAAPAEGEVTVEGAEAEEEAEDGKSEEDEGDEKAKADSEAKKKKATGWATGNDESDFVADPE